MTFEDIAAHLQALENEFVAGNVGFMNYKRVVKAVFDLAELMAEKTAALEERISALEAKSPELPKAGSFDNG